MKNAGGMRLKALLLATVTFSAGASYCFGQTATVRGQSSQERQSRELVPGNIGTGEIGAAETAAYQALMQRHTAEAEQELKAILAGQPNSTAALVGMGYVRMQQGNFLGAISYLEQARQREPGNKSVAAALDTARFWFFMSEGQNAAASGDSPTAEKRYRSALELRPNDVSALEELGDSLLKENRPQAAAPLFERAVTQQPEDAKAWKGLVASRVASGNALDALSAHGRMPQTVAATLNQDPLYLETLANAYAATGRGRDAQEALEAALKLPFPAVPGDAREEVQLHLAAELAANKQTAASDALYRQVLAADTGNLQAWKGLIQEEHGAGEDAKAAKDIQSMPASVREAAMKDPSFDAAVAPEIIGQGKLDYAQKPANSADGGIKAGSAPSIDAQMQIANLDIQRGTPQLAYPVFQQILRQDTTRVDAWAGLLTTLHLTGHDEQAAARLNSIPPAVRAQLEHNPSYLQTMASVYGDLGRSREADQFVRRAEQDYAAAQSTPPAEVEIQKAWLLYNGFDEAGLYKQLMRLGQRTDLSDSQKNEVQTIWANWAVRRANQAAAVGNKQLAFVILDSATQTFPNNPVLLRNLAVAFVQMGHPDRAVEIYKSCGMKSATAEDYEIAINAALAISDTKDSRQWLGSAMSAFPNNPQILLIAAKLEQVRGENNRAMELYRKSLAATPAEAKSPLPGFPSDHAHGPADFSLPALLAPTGPTGVGNPFATGPNSVPLPPAAEETSPMPAVANVGGSGSTASAPPAEEYRPYVSYIAPPPPTTTISPTHSAGSKNAVDVQLGNSTPPPVQPESEKTDVLPTEHYVPKSQVELNDPNVAAARAEQIRKLRAGSPDRVGQSHPPDDGTISASDQVRQPSTQPSLGGVPETGAQQYPQPRVQPVAPPQPNRVPTNQKPSADATTMLASPSTSQAPGLVGPPLLPQDESAVPTDAEIAARSMPLSGATLATNTGIAINPKREAQVGLASLEGDLSGWLGVTGGGRYRAGTPGLDRLFDIETPIEASAVVGHSVRFTAVALPVFLDSGALNVTGKSGYPPYLGTLPATTAFAPSQQYSDGIGGELQLNTRSFGIAVGYTPYNFLVHNLTGRIRFSPFRERMALFGERQPVKDTQLSYAGLHDPGAASTVDAGPVWGGVLATTGGVRLDLRDPVTGSGMYAVAQGGVLTGRHVQDNYRFGGTGGATFQVLRWNAGSFTTGGELEGAHYHLNEVGMSYGQGGYFSPQLYFSAGAPLAVRGSYRKNFHYDVAGLLGVQTLRQSMSLFYPLNPTLQAGFAPCSNPQTPSYSCGEYPSTATTSFNFRFHAEFSYLYGKRWYAGGFASADNSNNYNQVSAGFFFRYTFRPQVIYEGRPTGLFPVDGMREVEIP